MPTGSAADILALADDLTGALEVGAQFADSGIPAEVWTAAPKRDIPAALVIDTATRHLSGPRAAEKVRKLLRRFPRPFLFKKTDSTLRGEIRAELDAIRAELPSRPLVYAPAYPAMARHVRQGQLYVHGTLVHETEFARDALNRVGSSDVRDCCPGAALAADAPALVRHLADGLTAVICDGSADEDLTTVAQALPLHAVAVGPGAFARAWVNALPMNRSARLSRPTSQTGLLVCGRRHPVSRAQAKLLPHGGSVAEVRLLLQRHAWVSLLVGSGETESSAEDFARKLAAETRELLQVAPVESLIVFGGDTAGAVLASLRVRSVRPYGELLPGIPASALPEPCPPVLVTKAGGFGDTLVVEMIVQRLRGL